jgi:preprotein translocase subunit SecG
MATIPFALSISHLVSSAGADVGFAAILGLAVLVLLFFSQARETATLRQRADEAEEQLRQLAAYVDQTSRGRAAPTTQAPSTRAVLPAPPPAAARVSARQTAFPAASRPAPAPAVAADAGGVATIPAAPAGVGAPALSAATRLIPPAGADPISIRALKNADGDSAAASAPRPAGTAAVPAAASAGPPPSTAAGGANGSGRGHVAPPPTAAAGAPPRVPPRAETPPPGRPAGAPTFHDPVPSSGLRLSRVAIAAAAVVAVVLVVVAVLVVTNRGDGAQTAASTSASKASSVTSSRRRSRRIVAVTPASVTVAVLNGTTTTHLAADIMSKLTRAGYKPGTTTNAADQNLTSTVAGYTKPSFRADALAVAKSLNLGSASVQGVSPGDRSAACHATTAACPAQVVVTVGSDLASSASSPSTG